MKLHLFHPEAAEEYTRASQYYAAIAPELGRRFYDEIERLIVHVRSHPERFWQFSPPARRALARKFPYSPKHAVAYDVGRAMRSVLHS